MRVRCTDDENDGIMTVSEVIAIIADDDASPVNHPIAFDIAVVARVEPARIIVLVPVDGDVLDPAAERTVGRDTG